MPRTCVEDEHKRLSADKGYSNCSEALRDLARRTGEPLRASADNCAQLLAMTVN